jgi:hypothetical protein
MWKKWVEDKEGGCCWSTNKSYLSAFTTCYEKAYTKSNRHRNSSVFVVKSKFFQDCKKILDKMYNEGAVSTGRKLENHNRETLYYGTFVEIMKVLNRMSQDDPKSQEVSALTTLTWTAVGRISEAGSFACLKDFSFDPDQKLTKFCMTRTKAGVVTEDIVIFPNASDWATCPFVTIMIHLLRKKHLDKASWNSNDRQLFSSINQAKSISSKLQEIGKLLKLPLHYTSHSLRKGMVEL